MQNIYIFLKRASTRFRFYEKVLKKRMGLGLGLGEAIIFFLNTYLVGPFYKNTYLVGPFYIIFVCDIF